MKSYIITISLLFLQIAIYSQRKDSYWMLGYGNASTDSIWWGANLIFDTTGIQTMQTQHRTLNFAEAFSAISANNGQLFFYTNGNLIANANHDTIGQLLFIDNNAIIDNASARNQSALILPIPADTNQFYLFHYAVKYVNDDDPDVKGWNLYKTLLDKRLRNENGGIVYKNEIVLEDTLAYTGLTAVQHANGRDWWLVMPSHHADEYHIFLINPTGVVHKTQTIPQYPHTKSLKNQCLFAKNGDKYLAYDYTGTDKIYLMDFDRCAGIFSNAKSISTNALHSGGMALSANGKILYVVEEGHYLYQFNLNSTQPDTTKTLVATDNGVGGMFGGFSYGYLAPDNRIYFVDNTSTLTVINYPNVWGLGCDVQQHSIVIPTVNWGTIPNYPNFYLGALVGSGCDTLTSVIPPIEYAQARVHIYPNPAKEVVTLSLSSFTKGATCHFYTTLGECVKRIILKQDKTEVFVGDLPEGVYFYEVSSANTKYYGKFIIQR